MFGWFQRMLPQKGDFFAMFEAHAATLVAAAHVLVRLADDKSSTEKCLKAIEDHEHEADDIIREVLRQVRLTFLTPFDRGAITDLIAAMDDSIDEMLTAARAIHLYELDVLQPEMKAIVAIIEEQANVTAQAIPMLRKVTRNGVAIHDLTERVVRLEGDADDIHAKGLKAAFLKYDKGDAMKFIIAREVFKNLERVTDAFEDVANEIDGIVIDHS